MNNAKNILIVGALLVILAAGIAWVVFSPTNDVSVAPSTEGLSTSTATQTIATSSEQSLTENEARDFFEQFAKAESSYSLSIMDFYADEGILTVVDTDPAGKPRTREITFAQYKSVIPGALPQAKQLGDYNSYTSVEVSIQGDTAILTANRYNHYKKYNSDYTLTVKKIDGKLKIVAEKSVAK